MSLDKCVENLKSIFLVGLVGSLFMGGAYTYNKIFPSKPTGLRINNYIIEKKLSASFGFGKNKSELYKTSIDEMDDKNQRVSTLLDCDSDGIIDRKAVVTHRYFSGLLEINDFVEITEEDKRLYDNLRKYLEN